MAAAAPSPDTILKLGNAPFPALAMVAGMQLELFTPLGEGPMSAAQLAAALGVKESKLSPLLYALVSAGLLQLDGERFANTAEADHYLVKGKPTYLGERHLHYAARYQEASLTAATIRTGRAQAKKEFASMSTSELEKLLRGLHPAARASGRDLVRRYDFSRRRHLIDIGGGSGGVALAIAAACPSLRATIVDLTSVMPIANMLIGEEGMSGRVDAVPADAVHGPLPGRYDVAVMRSYIQVLSPDEARSTLRNLYHALVPGSPVYIVGQMLDDSRLAPAETVAFNLVFLNIFDDGQAYTESEHRSWLTEAEFIDVQYLPQISGGSSLVTARKPV